MVSSPASRLFSPRLSLSVDAAYPVRADGGPVAVALDLQLEDVRVVDQPVARRDRHGALHRSHLHIAHVNICR